MNTDTANELFYEIPGFPSDVEEEVERWATQGVRQRGGGRRSTWINILALAKNFGWWIVEDPDPQDPPLFRGPQDGLLALNDVWPN